MGAASRGRPKGSSDKPFRDMLRKVLAENDFKRLRLMTMAVCRKAEKGDLGALSIVLDRYEGKVPHAIGGTDELPAIKTHDVNADAARRVMDAMAAAGITLGDNSSSVVTSPAESVDDADSTMESMDSSPLERE